VYVLFGMGENPTADDLRFHVSDYRFSVSSTHGDGAPANCIPGEIDISLDLPPESNPGSEFLRFAKQQHETAGDEGAGKIVVYPGEGVGQSIQEITFKKGWIQSLNMDTSSADDRFRVSMRIAAAEVTVSGITFLHSPRAQHFVEAGAAA
jgi:hypothetical protein